MYFVVFDSFRRCILCNFILFSSICRLFYYFFLVPFYAMEFYGSSFILFLILHPDSFYRKLDLQIVILHLFLYTSPSLISNATERLGISTLPAVINSMWDILSAAFQNVPHFIFTLSYFLSNYDSFHTTSLLSPFSVTPANFRIPSRTIVSVHLAISSLLSFMPPNSQYSITPMQPEST